MAKARKRCEGVFHGLYVGQQLDHGVYPAIARGECTILPYVEDSTIPELLQLAEVTAEAFIQADIQREKRIELEKRVFAG